MRGSLFLTPLCAYLSAVAPVLAAEGAPEAERRAVVLMRSAGVDAATWDAALLAIRAQLGDVAVRIAVEQGPTEGDDLRRATDAATVLAAQDHAIGAFWISARGADVVLYVTEPKGGRVLVRRVQGEAGTMAAALEEIAVITRRSVEALLEGRSIGMEPVARPVPPPPPPPPERPAPPRKPERPVARTVLAVSSDAFAPSTPWEVGLALGAAWSPVDRVFLGAGYTFLPALDVDGGRAAARIARHPFELGIAYELPLGPVSIGAELLGEIDALSRATTYVGPGVTAAPSDVRWLGAVGGRARFVYRALSPVCLFASGGVDVVLNDFRYVVEGASPTPVALAPSSVRPRVDLGLAVDLR